MFYNVSGFCKTTAKKFDSKLKQFCTTFFFIIISVCVKEKSKICFVLALPPQIRFYSVPANILMIINATEVIYKQ